MIVRCCALSACSSHRRSLSPVQACSGQGRGCLTHVTAGPLQVQLQALQESGVLQQYVDKVLNTTMPMNVVSHKQHQLLQQPVASGLGPSSQSLPARHLHCSI